MPPKTYDDIAEWYAEWSRGRVQGDSLFEPVARLIGEVDGQRICDLACGEGRVARYLAARGADVLGIDTSARLLAIAASRRADGGRYTAYLRDDAQNLDSIPDSFFDGVVCHMALMDIPDLRSTVGTAFRVLRPSGWLVLSILHPCFHTPTSDEQTGPDGRIARTVSGYWHEGFWRSDKRVGPPGRIGCYHRTLSTYLNTLTERGFVIERAEEPQARGRQALIRPVWTEVPASLAMRCRKPSWDGV
jgi:ubiquinone/menaquinone biosynthesis C-methylase UbiE